MTEHWQEHRARLRGYIAARVPDHASVDDLLQDVFLRAFSGLHSLKSHGRLAPWLYRIAANVIADHDRSIRPGEDLRDNLAAPEPDDDPVAELAACLRPRLLGAEHQLRLESVELEMPVAELCEGVELPG